MIDRISRLLVLIENNFLACTDSLDSNTKMGPQNQVSLKQVCNNIRNATAKLQKEADRVRRYPKGKGFSKAINHHIQGITEQVESFSQAVHTDQMRLIIV
jgi:hypothetical protein